MVTLTRTPKNRPGGGVRSGGVAKVSTGGSWLQAHRALVAVLGVVLLAALGGGAYLLVFSGSGDTEAPTPAPARRAAPRTTGGVTGGVTGGASPGTSASPSPTATPAASGTGGRNPFAWIGGTASPTGGTPASSTSGTDPTIPSLVIPTFTATTRITATRTTTATATGGAVYLGLYGWTAEDLPMFRVNDSSYTPTAGAVFATSFVYISPYTNGSARCANVSYEGSAVSICEGEVLKLT